jgi:hypothetical protein
MSLSPKQTETEAKNALAMIVNAIDSHPGTGQVVKLVKFLAGIYNSHNYPFELAEFRGLDSRLANACLTYLAYDVLGIQEVHHLVPGGAKRLNKWFVDYGLREKDPSTSDLSSSTTNARTLDLNAKYVSHGTSPGYRSISLAFDVRELGSDEVHRIELNIGDPKDTLHIWEDILDVYRFAWRTERGPHDKKEGERRPPWLDRI